MKIGIIGLGMMGRTHYEAYQNIDGASVIAVADRNPKRASGDLSGTAGNVLKGGVNQLPMDKIRGMTKASDLIAMKDVDIVDICVPTPEHVDVAIEAIKAGKHVLCEKPLARTVAEAERIAAAARDAKGFFMPAMCIRFWPQWAWLKAGDRREALRQGFIRDLPPRRADAARVVQGREAVRRRGARSAHP